MWRAALSREAPTILAPVRLATWNVNSVVARLPRLVGWLESAKPDVLCLQETKIADAAFPRAEVEALGYELALHGDGRWNGVAILSKVGLGDVERGFTDEPGFPDARVEGAERDLCGRPRLVRVRAQRADARQRALSVQVALARLNQERSPRRA